MAANGLPCVPEYFFAVEVFLDNILLEGIGAVMVSLDRCLLPLTDDGYPPEIQFLD